MKNECRYCCEGDNGYLIDADVDAGVIGKIWTGAYINRKDKSLSIGVFLGDIEVVCENDVYIKINHCPMCGRKL